MVIIQNERGETLEVTKGAFEEIYAAQGYSIVSEGGGQTGQASNGQTSGFTGNPEQDAKDASEVQKANEVAQEAKARKAKSE
jgi:hypothetical protein